MLPKNLFYVLLLIAYAYEQKSKIMRYDIKYRDSICVLAFGITYLSYRLQVAKLQKDARKCKRAVWWVFVQSILLSNATQIHFTEFSLLQTKLMETVMPMLHDEYVKKLNKKKR